MDIALGRLVAAAQPGRATVGQAGHVVQRGAGNETPDDLDDAAVRLAEHEGVERRFGQGVLRRDRRMLAAENDLGVGQQLLGEARDLVGRLVVRREHAGHADDVIAAVDEPAGDALPGGAPVQQVRPAGVRRELHAIGVGVVGGVDHVVVARPGERVEDLDVDVGPAQLGREVREPDRHVASDLDHARPNRRLDQQDARLADVRSHGCSPGSCPRNVVDETP